MAIYFSLYSLIMFTGIICYSKGVVKRKNSARVFCIVSSVMIILVEGLRSIVVGIDTRGYVLWFKEYCQIRNITSPFHPWRGIEIGYSVLNILISRITDDEHVLIFVVSFLIVILNMLFIYKCSPNALMSVTLFFSLNFFFTSMVSWRQLLAMPIVSWMYPLLQEKKYKLAVVAAILAYCFHDTSVLFVLILFLLNTISKNKNSVLFVLGMGIAGFVLIQILIKIVLRILPAYEFYNNEIYFHSEINYEIGKMDSIFVLLGLFIIFVIYVDHRFHEEKFYFLSNIIAVSVILIFMGMRINEMFRMVYYPKYFYMILIPEMVNRLNRENKFFMKIVVYVACFAFFLYYLTHNPGNTVPYEFFTADI